MEDILDRRKSSPIRLMVRTANLSIKSKHYPTKSQPVRLSRVANITTKINRVKMAKRTLYGEGVTPCCIKPVFGKTRSWQTKQLHRYLVSKAKKHGVRQEVVQQVHNTIEYLGHQRKNKDTVSADTTHMYMQDVGHKTLLSPEQEYKIAILIKQGNEEARKIMVESNLRLVIKIAKGYMNRGVSFMDLIEEGNLGLMHAIEKFEPEKGFRFSTYATWWIRQDIERAIMCHSTNVRVPVHVRKEMNVYTRAAMTLSQQLDHEPSHEEIADFVGRPVEAVRKVMELKVYESSIDAPASDDSSVTVGANLVDPETKDPSELNEQDDLKVHMKDWMKCLDQLERKVLVYRYGLDESVGVITLDDLGEKLGLTRERVRQIQMTGLKKLHHYLDDHDIESPFGD